MPDVCFSGWFCVIDFMIRHKPVLLFFFYQKITGFFFFFFCNIGQLTLISQFVEPQTNVPVLRAKSYYISYHDRSYNLLFMQHVI